MLIIIFSLLYGVISYVFVYYGEMTTYLGMTAPMSVFALAYAANDAVLIVLWGLAALTDISYTSVVTCVIMFLVNDTYTFVNWRRIYRRQQARA